MGRQQPQLELEVGPLEPLKPLVLAPLAWQVRPKPFLVAATLQLVAADFAHPEGWGYCLVAQQQLDLQLAPRH